LQLYIVTFVIQRKEKLIARFLSMPSDFHYDEMVKLLGYFGFEEVKKRKDLRIQGEVYESRGYPDHAA